MKKVTARQYAQVLYNATKGKPAAQLDRITGDFLKLVVRNKHSGLLKKIAALYREVRNTEESIVEVLATSAHPLTDAQVNHIKKAVAKSHAAADVRITETVDPEVRGGLILRIGDEIIDGSLRTRIETLRRHLTTVAD